MRMVYVIVFVSIAFQSILEADDTNLSSILKRSGTKESLVKKKNQHKKKEISHYSFTFEKEISQVKEEVETYEYNNTSRFRFKFTNEPPQSNFIRPSAVGSELGGGAAGASGQGNGRGGGKGR